MKNTVLIKKPDAVLPKDNLASYPDVKSIHRIRYVPFPHEVKAYPKKYVDVNLVAVSSDFNHIHEKD